MSRRRVRARQLDLRPLDPVRSIKAKLGLLVGVSVAVTAATMYAGIVLLDVQGRHWSGSSLSTRTAATAL